jgi:hypothetical protein
MMRTGFAGQLCAQTDPAAAASSSAMRILMPEF